jgi:hypothetical protein
VGSALCIASTYKGSPLVAAVELHKMLWLGLGRHFRRPLVVSAKFCVALRENNDFRQSERSRDIVVVQFRYTPRGTLFA